MPCVPYAGPDVGIAFLPESGSGVWIEFEGGDVSYPIWTGGYWREGEVPADAADHVKVIITTAPHKIEFDDDQGSITLSDPNGNTVTLDSSGITLTNGQSTVVVEQLERVSEQRRAGGAVNDNRPAGLRVSRSGSTQPRSRPRRPATPHHVDQMIRQLLLTDPGERVNLPQFGCGLRSLVFAPNSDALAATVQLRVIQGLQPVAGRHRERGRGHGWPRQPAARRWSRAPSR